MPHYILLLLEQKNSEFVSQNPNKENLPLSQFQFPRSTVSAGYVDDLIQKTVKYCMKDDNDKPSLPTAPPSLASAYIHPDKEHIPLFSHYKKYI